MLGSFEILDGSGPGRRKGGEPRTPHAMTQPQPARPSRKALGCLLVVGFFFALGALGELLGLAADRPHRELEEPTAVREEPAQLDLEALLTVYRSPGRDRIEWDNRTGQTLTGAVWRIYSDRGAYEQSATDVMFGGPFAPHRLRQPMQVPPGEGSLDASLLVKDGARFVPGVHPMGVVSLRCEQGAASWAFD